MNKQNKRLTNDKKYALTITEASEYFNIGQTKLRKIVMENKYNDFSIMNGNKILFKRKRFEEWLDQIDSI
ncbi:MAG TPA: excisionase [Oscillospiraceae bacterium]|nr:excisionase [Oscillospiraceae bacterium]